MHEQTVAVVVGDNIRHNEITKLIAAHHGKCKIINAFYHRRNRIQHFNHELRDADIIIMIQNYMKHATSKSITNVASSKHKKFAIANSAGLQSIEQAIYRADKDIKAYENSSSTIDYPMK